MVHQPPSRPPLQITVARPFQWRDYKVIRLEALQLEPDAFGATYAETVVWPDDYWRRRLESRESVLMIARRGREPVGLAGAFTGPNDGANAVAIIFGVYLRASERGHGEGRRLLAALIAQVSARFPETRTLRLWVHPEQAAAHALYTGLGFRAVPNTDPGAAAEAQMERPLRP